MPFECNCTTPPTYCTLDVCIPPGPHCQYCARPLPSLTPEIEVISGAVPGTPTLKGNSMLSKLIDARDEAQQAISEINDKIEELQNAIYELERFEESVSDLIDTLENVDGARVYVSVDSVDISLSLDL